MKKSIINTMIIATLMLFSTTFIQHTLCSSTTKLEVTPAVYSATEENTKFTINVTVTNVQDLFAWQFKLRYNSSLVFEGYKINENFFSPTPKNGDGYLFIGGTIVEGKPLNGDVFLASIYFTATVPGEYAFDLFETALLNSDKENIPHQVVDGVPNIIHDIALLGLTSDPSGWVPVPQGDPVYIDVTVKNNGNFTETFSLKVYADRDVSILLDELVVAEATVSLEPGEISTINLIWDTTDAPYGSYYLSAKAQITDDNMENNFIKAASFVGGICRRWNPPSIDYTPFITAVASTVTIIGLLAAILIGVFKALATIRMPNFSKISILFLCKLH